jgi:hypothetical protein
MVNVKVAEPGDIFAAPASHTHTAPRRVSDPDSIAAWIRIRIPNADRDQGGPKRAKIKAKTNKRQEIRHKMYNKNNVIDLKMF